MCQREEAKKGDHSSWKSSIAYKECRVVVWQNAMQHGNLPVLLGRDSHTPSNRSSPTNVLRTSALQIQSNETFDTTRIQRANMTPNPFKANISTKSLHIFEQAIWKSNNTTSSVGRHGRMIT